MMLFLRVQNFLKLKYKIKVFLNLTFLLLKQVISDACFERIMKYLIGVIAVKTYVAVNKLRIRYMDFIFFSKFKFKK